MKDLYMFADYLNRKSRFYTVWVLYILTQAPNTPSMQNNSADHTVKSGIEM